MCLLQGGELHILVCHFDLPLDCMGFPYSSVSKESACNARDTGSIPGSGRSPEEGNGNPLQYFCLENPMDRGTWKATLHGVTRVGHDLATKPPLPGLCTFYNPCLNPWIINVEHMDIDG